MANTVSTALLTIGFLGGCLAGMAWWGAGGKVWFFCSPARWGTGLAISLCGLALLKGVF